MPLRASAGPDAAPGSRSDYLVIGKLRRPHGLAGEMLMDVYTDFPERVKRGVTVWVGESLTPKIITSRRAHGAALLLGFEGYSTPEEVGELRNQLVYVRRADRPPLPEGEYYHHQLLGLRVVSDQGVDLGVVAQLLETGANDVFVVRPAAGAEILLPAIPSVIESVDLNAGVLHVHLLPGLLPE